MAGADPGILLEGHGQVAGSRPLCRPLARDPVLTIFIQVDYINRLFLALNTETKEEVEFFF